MPPLQPDERQLLRRVSELSVCNPFLPERVELERQALGEDFQPWEPVWSLRVAEESATSPNAARITERLEALLAELPRRLAAGSRGPGAEDRALCRDAVDWLLYHRFEPPLFAAIGRILDSRDGGRVGFPFYRDFRSFHRRSLESLRLPAPAEEESAHLFACCFQVRRAFHHIVSHIIGGALSAARLRAAVWESIFSHDMRRYRRELYHRMGDFTTLITGPSGTGKELAAQAIGLSRYVPFDPGRCTFASDFSSSFFALNPSALAPTLVESELFGHRRGSFTGALQDHAGWLEVCPPLGTVFLDEIGDLAPQVQVKLLRVIQTRLFQRIGDTEDRTFRGKLVAATHRDLAGAMRRGEFREDLYYRLCADRIHTPSLKEQLDEAPAVLDELLLFLARRLVGGEAEEVAGETRAWIRRHLGDGYPWPGNIRELDQCLRNVLIHGAYHPPAAPSSGPRHDPAAELLAGDPSAEELLRRYCTWIYRRTGSYQEAARRLGLDRRTVKAKVDREWPGRPAADSLG